jgi:subtilase family serine protease
MKKYSGIPELLGQYMVENDTNEQWVTVQELRKRFGLTRYQYNTISGFLRRLEFRSFG